jgi:hypothetical protein
MDPARKSAASPGPLECLVMRLAGIMDREKYYHAHGIHNGIPYRITEEHGRFILEAEKIVPGLGLCVCPIAFFDESFEGVYYDT